MHRLMGNGEATLLTMPDPFHITHAHALRDGLHSVWNDSILTPGGGKEGLWMQPSLLFVVIL